MYKHTFFVILSLTLLVVTCKESPTKPSTTQPISFRVTVQDQSGNPVPGAKISAWNIISGFHPAPRPAGGKSSSGIQALTSMPFLMHDSGLYFLRIQDLDGRTVQAHQGSGPAGVHMLSWEMDTLPSTVYKAVLAISDSGAQNARFRDSLYVTLYRDGDPVTTLLGRTNQVGLFETSDSTRFPFLYGLGSMPLTGPGSPQPIGTFSFSDQVALIVTDSVHGLTGYDTVTITPGHTIEAPVTLPSSTPIAEESKVSREPNVTSTSSQGLRGDLNCDGVAYQPADAATYVDYYMRGLMAFDSLDCSIIGSDVNADGAYLGIDDFVSLIRVILGDSDPFPKIPANSIPVPVHIGISDTTGGCFLENLSNDSLGVILLVVRGQVTPSLLAPGSAMEFLHTDNGATRILIYPPYQFVSHTNGFGRGRFLKFEGATSMDISLLSGATVYAQPISVVQSPTKDELLQNYPNPFN